MASSRRQSCSVRWTEVEQHVIESDGVEACSRLCGDNAIGSDDLVMDAIPHAMGYNRSGSKSCSPALIMTTGAASTRS